MTRKRPANFNSVINNHINGNHSDFRRQVKALSKTQLLKLFLSLHDDWTNEQIVKFIYEVKTHLEIKGE